MLTAASEMSVCMFACLGCKTRACKKWMAGDHPRSATSLLPNSERLATSFQASNWFFNWLESRNLGDLHSAIHNGDEFSWQRLISTLCGFQRAQAISEGFQCSGMMNLPPKPW